MNPSKTSDSLPPPDMSYHLKRDPCPLKLPTSFLSSSFILPDNTVCFIGTRHCGEENRQKFLDFVFGRNAGRIEEDFEPVNSKDVGKVSERVAVGNSISSLNGSDRNNADDLKMSGTASSALAVSAMVISGNRAGGTDESEPSSTKLPRHGAQHECSNTSDNNECDTSMIELLQDPRVLQDFIDGGSSSSSDDSKMSAGCGANVISRAEAVTVTTPHIPAAQGEGSGTSGNEYNTSMDMELLQDPQILRDFIDDDSSSSDDAELPRVNVTGTAAKHDVVVCVQHCVPYWVSTCRNTIVPIFLLLACLL